VKEKYIFSAKILNKYIKVPVAEYTDSYASKADMNAAKKFKFLCHEFYKYPLNLKTYFKWKVLFERILY